MRNGYRIIDADRHVVEPAEVWERYLEPEFARHAPRHIPFRAGEPVAERMKRFGARGLLPVPPALAVDGAPVMHKLSDRARIELAAAKEARSSAPPRGDRPEVQVRQMDRTGIDVGFLYPTFTHYLVHVDEMDPALSCAFARAHNRWLAEYCDRAPGRLFGVGVVSRHDPDEMVRELERVASYGWKAVVVRPNPVRGRTLSDPAYEPFWSACEELSIAVAVHEGTHARVPTAGADRFETRFALHACSHPMEQMMAFLSLVEGGVLERHPALRVAFLEAGCGWLPYWLWRLDTIEYAHLAGEVEENVKRRPSEYFRRQCFVAVEPGEPYLPRIVDSIGEDNLLFGTDFPHLDHDDDIVDEVLALEEKLPPGALRKMLWDNPARFYGLAR